MRRRDLLEALGRIGGSTTLYGAMTALGLLPKAAEAGSTAGTTFRLEGERKRGRSILILGAGLAGMGAAYELTKKGYDCHILEARKRPGGRCHTIRGGTIEEEVGGLRQTCNFDPGMYFNPGPARIPQHHVTLDYCRELGVAIEPFAQVNESAYIFQEGPQFGALSGKKVRAREARADLTGYTHELLCKAMSQSALDETLTAEDRQRLLAYLMVDGGLDGERHYRSGYRRGYRVNPGAADAHGEPSTAYALKDLLQADLGENLTQDYDPNWQPMLFQVVGGMDNLAKAFATALGKRITYEAQIVEIRQKETGVTVVYRDRQGKNQTAQADYCLCTIPPAVLKDIPADFAPERKAGLKMVSGAETAKIAFQFKRRFWEEDDRIFGGITRTSLPITQIFYPSTGFLGKKGVVVGCYNFGQDAEQVGAMDAAARIEFGMKNGTRIHPQYPAEYETAFSVAWHKVPFTLGGWGNWGGTSRFDLYPLLCKPDGRVYFAGEHLSYLSAWMAGALESARVAVKAIHERSTKEKTH